MSESPLALHTSTSAELKERVDAVRAGVPHLVFRDGAGGQVLLRLDGARPRLTIGRRAENDIALPWDDRASRVHAELECVGGEWVIADAGLSSNGTFVGEEKVIGRRRLRNGDVMRVGSTLLAFCAPDDPAATSADSGAALSITPAQRRVLVALCRPSLAARGYAAPPGNAGLARELYLSVDSVKTHLKALFEAFELDGVPQGQKRARLVAHALRLGIVTERDAA